MTDFFGPGSPFVVHPLLSEERSAAIDPERHRAKELTSLVSSCGFVVRQIVDDAIVTPPNMFMTLVAECPAG